jgi:hypothetical protein
LFGCNCVNRFTRCREGKSELSMHSVQYRIFSLRTVCRCPRPVR